MDGHSSGHFLVLTYTQILACAQARTHYRLWACNVLIPRECIVLIPRECNVLIIPREWMPTAVACWIVLQGLVWSALLHHGLSHHPLAQSPPPCCSLSCKARNNKLMFQASGFKLSHLTSVSSSLNCSASCVERQARKYDVIQMVRF
jgi:hypothetical protein